MERFLMNLSVGVAQECSGRPLVGNIALRSRCGRRRSERIEKAGFDCGGCDEQPGTYRQARPRGNVPPRIRRRAARLCGEDSHAIAWSVGGEGGPSVPMAVSARAARTSRRRRRAAPGRPWSRRRRRPPPCPVLHSRRVPVGSCCSGPHTCGRRFRPPEPNWRPSGRCFSGTHDVMWRFFLPCTFLHPFREPGLARGSHGAEPCRSDTLF